MPRQGGAGTGGAGDDDHALLTPDFFLLSVAGQVLPKLASRSGHEGVLFRQGTAGHSPMERIQAASVADRFLACSLVASGT